MDTAQNTPLSLIEDPDMGITLSDGCRLSARVWRPENSDTAPVPVILEYLPYRKRDGTTARDALTTLGLPNADMPACGSICAAMATAMA